MNNENVLAGLTGDDTRESIFGAFVDAEYHPFEKVVLGAGARYDYYQVPESRLDRTRTARSRRAPSIVFHALPELTLRTNYGRAFRAPALAELAINQQMYAATLLGNPDLQGRDAGHRRGGGGLLAGRWRRPPDRDGLLQQGAQLHQPGAPLRLDLAVPEHRRRAAWRASRSRRPRR